MTPDIITANGRPTETKLPCTLEEILAAKKLLPRDAVLENNGDFARRRFLCNLRSRVVR